ncbi:hypothetical protein [Amycolatopsis anabasis]|uniref:hypothetical protein n=1 Tax=Amycolatopsis anabasis TaxID=1840409 RepID=UPI00131C7D1A|nr:hypothetical protein [Amycolatopsis anabasis]
MTEQRGPKADPTADWLAEIRPEETPWRTERPATAEPAPDHPDHPVKWARTRKAARIAGQAAPYVQTAALAGWVATEIFDDDVPDPGFDASTGMDGGA